MVKIKDVRAANAAFKQSATRPNMVALFVGATSGIGLATLKHFTVNSTSPKIYFVGRSKTAAKPIIRDLEKLNPEAIVNFIESEISLIKNVDAVCEEIKTQEKQLDLLFMSPGRLSFSRNENSEGIDIPQALRYYSRLRFVNNLLPLLNKSQVPRVVSVLAGGKEEALDFTDLEVKNFGVLKAAGNVATQTTLAFEELAECNPNVTFIHKFPGLVSTGLLENLLGTASGVFAIPATLIKFILLPIVNLIIASPDIAGERGLFVATDPRFVPSVSKSKSNSEVTPPKNSVYTGEVGNGVYLLDESDESAPDTAVMQKYREDGSSKKVWEDTKGVWSRALSSYT